MKKTFSVFLFFLSLQFMSSCSDDNQSTNFKTVNTESTENRKGIKFKIDSIKIEVKDLLSYYNIANITSLNNELVYVCYDDKRHSLNSINLSSKKVLKSVKLDRDGPKGISEISGLYCQSPDSIFAFSDNNLFLYLLDSNGSIKNKWFVNEKDASNETFYNKNVFSARQDAFYYDNSRKSIFIRNFNYEKSISTEAEAYYNTSKILGKLDLEKFEPHLLDIEYSSKLKNNYVGYLDEPSFTFVKTNDKLKKIIYIFPSTSDIFSYDLITKENIFFKSETRPIKLNIEYLPWNVSDNNDKKLQAINSDVIYGKIIHIPYKTKNFFVQFCLDSPETSSETLSRTAYMIIYDSSFNSIYVKKMPKIIGNYLKAFSWNNEIYIPQLKSETQINFLKMVFEELN